MALIKVMVVYETDEVVYFATDHRRLLRDPILIPDMRHTGIVINGGCEQMPVEPEGLFNEQGSPKRALHKLVTETVR